MKKIILLAILMFLLVLNGYSNQIWTNPITVGRPISNYYLGDKLPSPTYFSFEIGQASWNSSQVGIGQNPDGSTGWNWADAGWYQDNGGNKDVRRDLGGIQFTATGVWYSVGRAKDLAGDAWTYADEGGWSNNQALTASSTIGNCPYYNVNALGNPTSCTATISGTTATLGWTKFTGGSNTYNVMIVRYAKDATPTAPTNTTSYILNASIGTGTVVYATNNGTSTTNTVVASTDYDYYFYSENWNYYSSGVKVTALAPTTPVITSFSTANNNGTTTSGYAGTTVTVTGTNLGSISILKVGGSGGTGISMFSKNSTTITFTASSGLNGTIYVSDGTNSFTSVSSYVDLGYITNAATDWNTGSTWLGGAIPSSNSTVTIANSITINTIVSNAINNLTINSSTGTITFGASGALTANSVTNNGTVDMTSGGTLNITKSTAGSTTDLTNTGTWSSGSGTSKVVFTGAPSSGDAIHVISGTIGFNNISINKTSGSSNVGASFGSGSTITGTMEIGTGGFVSTAPPTSFYNSTAILKFNQGSGATYDVNAGDYSWSTTQIPQNITITTGTVNLNADRTASGNLLINGGALVLNNNTPNLTIQGNWTRTSGSFTANTGTVTLSGSSDGTVNVTGGATMNTLVVAKTSGAKAICNSNLTTTTLTINTNAIFSVNPGNKLTVYGTSTNNGTLNILSDVTGTATILTSTVSGTGTSNVQQYLASARNWYVSSPVTGATTPAGYTVYRYNEPTNAWISLSQGSGFDATKGYIALPSGEATITFSGTLNNGNVTTSSLTRSTGVAKEGFNLVGNPYPSFLNVSTIDTTKVLSSYWLRSKNSGGSSYVFDTYNLAAGLGTSLSGKALTAYIPPMQSFWVRVKTGQSPSTLTFTNGMRFHSDNVNNVFRAPELAKVTQQVLYLQVTNGVNTDETILAFNPNASNTYDAYDSPKMSNNSITFPELYTIVNDEQLAINGLNSIPYDTEIPLGFTTGETNTFTIKASEFSNFDSGAKVYLIDKLLNKETELTVADYTFESDIASSSTRFSLIFKAPSVATGLSANSENSGILVYRNMNNQIVVNCDGSLNNESSIAVYNGIGQKLASKQLKTNITVFDNPLCSGVYMVTITNAGKSITKKVTIN